MFQSNEYNYVCKLESTAMKTDDIVIL